MIDELFESYEMRTKAAEDKAEKIEKALKEACKHIADAAEPNCGNCPLGQGDKCPNCEDMTERCWEFIKEHFMG